MTDAKSSDEINNETMTDFGPCVYRVGYPNRCEADAEGLFGRYKLPLCNTHKPKECYLPNGELLHSH